MNDYSNDTFVQLARASWRREQAKTQAEEVAAVVQLRPTWQRQAAMVNPTVTQMIDEGYKKNEVVSACVNRLSRAFKEGTLCAYESEELSTKVVDHRIRELLMAPNDDMGEGELLSYVSNYRAIAGACLLWKQRDNAGRTRCLWPFHYGQMMPVLGRNTAEGIIAYYVLFSDEAAGVDVFGIERQRFDSFRGIAIPKSEIVHWKWANDPKNPGLGIGPIALAARSVSTDNEESDYIFSLLKNNAMPPTIITMADESPANTDEDLRKRYAAEWFDKFGRRGRNEPVAIMPHGFNVKQTEAFSLEQLAAKALRNVSEARICASFDVPVELVGISAGLENSTYNNKQTSRREFYEDKMVSDWKEFASEMRASFADEPNFENVYLAFDLSQVRALKESEDAQQERDLNSLNASAITVAEYRERQGLEIGPEHEVYKVPISTMFVRQLVAEATISETAVSDEKTNSRQPATKAFSTADKAMVAFFLSDEQAGRLTQSFEGAALPDELHLTLVYLGVIDDLSIDEGQLISLVQEFAATHTTIQGQVSGYGRMTRTRDDGTSAVYANFDSPDLIPFRSQLAEMLATAGVDIDPRDFLPHITLGYWPIDQPLPDVMLPEDNELVFDAMVVSWGERRHEVGLNGRKWRQYKNFPVGDGGASSRRASQAEYDRQRSAVLALRQVRGQLESQAERLIQDYFDEYATRAEQVITQFKSAPVNGHKVGIETYLGEVVNHVKQEVVTIDQAVELGSAIASYFKMLTDSELNQLEALLFGQERPQELEQIIKQIQLSTIEESWSLLGEIVGETEIVFNRNDPIVTRLLQTSGTRVKNITNSTQSQLQELLQYGNDNGWSIDDYINGDGTRPGISDFIKETYNGRSRTIARTEIGTAQQNATVERYAETGVKRVIVFDNQLPNSHPTCEKLDGTTQTLAWAKANPLQHPNCVRAFGASFED